MKTIWSVALLLSLNCSLFAADAPFTLCKSTYALCTTAPCKPVPGKKGYVSCDCDVKENQYSAGTKPCTGAIKTEKGVALKSRYSPIKSYVSCGNSRPWAFCLDSPCMMDAKNPKKAACLCSLVKDQGNYVIVTDHYDKNSCTTGIYSSATVKDVEEITAFLKTQSELPPYSIKVLNGN